MSVAQSRSAHVFLVLSPGPHRMLLSDWSRAAGVRRSRHALPIKTVPWTSPRDLPIENVKMCKIKINKVLPNMN